MENPKFHAKIKPLEGEISKPKLGLTQEDWETLTNRVSIIFHVAATTKFTEPLKIAIKTNVRSTEEVKNLALSCRHLVSVVFVGTAFSQFLVEETERVEEKFYQPPMKPTDAIEMDENFSEETMEHITPK